MTEVERPVLTAMMNRVIYPEGQRDLAAADAVEKTLAQPLGVLDGALAGTPICSATISRRRSQRRQHPRLGAPGAHRHGAFPKGRPSG